MKKRTIIALLTAFALTLSGCTIHINTPNSLKITKTKNEKNVVELDGVKKVDFSIDIGVGKLKVEGGSDKLIDGQFIYNIEEWKPIVDYSKNNDTGRLQVKQPSSHFNNTPPKSRYEWNLLLNSDVLFDIDGDMGVGKSELDLSRVNFNNLDLDLGVGDTKIDMSGNYNHDITADIDGGVGSITIYLPKNMKAILDVEAGLGNVSVDGFVKNGSSYTYDGNGASNTINITIHAGVGSVKVKLKDSKANTSSNEKPADTNIAYTIDELSKAVFVNNTEAVDKILKSNKVDINTKDSDGKYPLEQALVLENCEMAETLLANGADPNKITSDGITIYAKATADNQSNYMKKLFNYYK